MARFGRGSPGFEKRRHQTLRRNRDILTGKELEELGKLEKKHKPPKTKAGTIIKPSGFTTEVKRITSGDGPDLDKLFGVKALRKKKRHEATRFLRI